MPEAHFDRMLVDLRSFGFTDITELPHGKTITLTGKTKVASYQFGVSLDSALIVTDGETTLLNVNDCKLMGSPLKHLCDAYSRPDFVFRSHSSASAYPYCVRSYNPDHLKWRTNEHYVAEFLAFANRVNARFATPFASNHCFLHRETREFNDTVVPPEEVKEYFDAHNKGVTQCVVMVPGDSWSREGGFDLSDHDYFTNRDYHLEQLEAQYADRLQAFYREEDAVRPSWEAFERYFTRLLKGLPWALKLVFPARVLFKVKATPEVYWLVDFKERRVEQVPDDNVQCHLVVEVHPAVLNDCVRKRMFSVFTASKRVRFEIREGPLRHLLLYTRIMDMHESGYFPLSSMFSRRFIRSWLRRWREVFWYARVGFQLLVTRRGFSPAEHI